MKINKKSLSRFAVFFLSVFSIGSLYMNNLYAWSAGTQAYVTGAPGDNGSCNVCHFALNSGSATFSINVPATVRPRRYVRVTVVFATAIGTKHGFEMTALDANGNRVGTFKNIGNTTQVILPNDSRGLQSKDRGKYIEQTTAGTSEKSWAVKWKAPAGATNPITFYAAGIDADGNGNFNNDLVYTATAKTNAR